MGLPEQIEQLKAQIAELQAWKASVEAVWPQIVESVNEPD